MSKIIEADGEMTDPLLLKLAADISPITETIEKDVDGNHALFVLGVKYSEEKGEEKENVQTYVAAAGFFGVIAEGLYEELFDQLTNGQTDLFCILRDVVRDLEEDLNIDQDEDFGTDAGPTLH